MKVCNCIVNSLLIHNNISAHPDPPAHTHMFIKLMNLFRMLLKTSFFTAAPCAERLLRFQAEVL
jgi:hypothetical protein